MLRNIAVILLVGLGILAAGVASAQPEESVRGSYRDRAPAIDVRDFNLKSYEGKVVMIAFWQGRECPTCESYISWLSDMQGRYGEEGLIIVAVNQDLESAAASDLANNIHSRSQIVLDPTRKMASSYQIEGVPSTYLHDRNLNLAEKFTGFVKEETEPMEKAVEKLLKKKYKD